MKVTVLSGSPKGKNSVSLQSMNFLSKKFPDHEYEVFHVGQNINKIVSDNESSDAIIKSVEAAELVLWVSPSMSAWCPPSSKGKDAFIEFFKATVNQADIIIFAGATKDRWLSSKWKQFFDRSFFQNHTPSLKGKQTGLIVSGPVSQMPTLNEVIDGSTQGQGANLVDIVSDESCDSRVIDSRIDALAERSMRLSRKGYVRPETFLGVGSKKVFRDDVWGRHRFVFQADHKYYEENGLYDFPHDDAFAMETNKNMLKLTEDPEMREAIRKIHQFRFSERLKPTKPIC